MSYAPTGKHLIAGERVKSDATFTTDTFNAGTLGPADFR